MAQEEVYGSRDRSYSAWHRRKSIRRFVGIEKAQTLAMIDLDGSLYVEYDDGTKEPLALIETAMDRGQTIKPYTVTKKLARRAHPVLPAFVLLYRISNTENPADPSTLDIDQFRVKAIWPEPESDWYTLTPLQWARALCQIRIDSAHQVDLSRLD